MNKNQLNSLVKELKEKSFDYGYSLAIWESTPGGVGRSTEDMDKLYNELQELYAFIQKELEKE